VLNTQSTSRNEKILAARIANTFKESPEESQKFEEQNFVNVNEFGNIKKYEQEYYLR
jgi:hypothetical protein